MQTVSTARRRALFDDDNNGSTSGGPGGVTGRGPDELKPEDTGALTGLYRRGAATAFVKVLSEGPMQLRRLRQTGMIETRQSVTGKDEAKLMPAGLQHVIAAAQGGAPRA